MSALMLQTKRLAPGLTSTQKVFVRSRNGGYTKIVREHYLRKDIPCYSQLCNKCPSIIKPDAQNNLPPFVLLDSPNAYDSEPHYVVVDTNVILQSIDLLEHPDCFYDVVIPQVVLEEVKNRSLAVYQRVRALVKAYEKRFVVFHNEFHEETYVVRSKGETINDRNDRAIRRCAQWYEQHLNTDNSKTKVKVVFVCNDRDNRNKALEMGIVAKSTLQYIESLPNSDVLRDLVPSEFESFAKGNESHFPEYYTPARTMAGIRNGTLYQGALNISTYNVLEGTVSTPAFKKPLLIQGSLNLNRAFHSDFVIVELLPKSKWREPSSTIVEELALDAGDEAPDSGVISDKERRVLAQEAMRATTDTERKLQPTARVVGIARRSWRYYVGQIAPTSVSLESEGISLRECSVVLMDKLLPNVRISTRKGRELLGQRIVVSVDSWPSHSKHPQGHYVRSLGPVEDAEAETEALLLEHNVEYRPFSKAVLDCLPAEGDLWKVLTIEPGRRDLRDRLVCSIDPPGCVDIDDALHARALPNGNFEVGVHIADVTHFVKPGTALDSEGALRGTLVYLVDKRIDMLPMLLGTNLCSLKPYVDRFAFSVLWEVDADANIVLVDFSKLVIKLREAFSYEAAQLRIDDEAQQDELTQLMRVLLRLSQKLRQKRMDAGALNLASPEVKVHVDSETLDPGEVEIKQLLATNSLVEEFMLFANISVARKIHEAYPQTAMLRRHGAPPSSNFEDLNEMLRVRKNMSISVALSRALADSLDRCVDPDDGYFNTLVRIMLTRCMMAAEYFSLGQFGYAEYRHYGLAVDIYTHFTSPIRRYCDVVAHRQLAGAIGYEPLDASHRDKHQMETIVRNINRRHRNAQFAGRASIEYYVGQAMRNNTHAHDGYVIKCYNNGIVVLVPKFGIEGLILVENMGKADLAVYDEKTYELTFETDAGERKIGVFDRVAVEVRSVLDEVSGKRKAQLVLK